MPPEPLSWDRKDLFKERKQERSEPFGPVARWRESPSHHAHRDFNRWAPPDFRRHPGHGKQGGWHMFSEDCSHGYTQPRPCHRMREYDTCRETIGKYGRNSRDNRRSFSQRDLRGHSLETSNESPNIPGRPHEMNDQRAVDDSSAYTSHTHFDCSNTGDQLPLKDKHDKLGVNGSGTSQRCDKENPLGSLEWKTLKWARSGSLSLCGSGFNHSSSSKSMGAVDSSEAKAESLPKNVSPVRSPSGDAATFVTSTPKETISRKKPRLKWGEGLAKYEKKKVDVPDEGLNRNVTVFSASNSDPVYANGSSFSDKSPRVNSFSDCASPATPSSVACSSSPGLEEKLFVKTIKNDDNGNLCMSPGPGMLSHLGRSPFNLEKMDASSIANLASSRTELLQSDDPSPMDSSFVRSTAINKLLVWKGDISKELEVTETEIDMLENELKSLKSESGGICARPAASSSLQVESNVNASNEQGFLIPRPAPLQMISCGDTTMEEVALYNGALEDAHADVKDEDIDSPGTATSKFVEPPSLVNSISPSVVGGNVECMGNSLPARIATPGLNCLISGLLEKTGEPTCEHDIALKIVNAEPVSWDLSLHANKEGMPCKLILTSNKKSADQAHEVFNKSLPCNQYKSDTSEVTSDSICQNESLIRKIFATRKRLKRFKERAITLKFKALRHLWKEDLQVLSIKKRRAKSQKKLESSLRIAQSGFHKHRSSIRPRLPSPGSLSMIPTAEILTFTGKIQLSFEVRPYRNALKMPSLILDKKERTVSRFATSNGLVEDPCAVEKERAMINPWMPEEREIFMEKLSIYGKDFSKIASSLKHKTTADCVEFYYKNHKSDCFEKTKKKLDVRKGGKPSGSTYMMTAGKKWNQEVNAASLDMLGAVSVMAARTNSNMVNRHAGRFYLGDYSGAKISQGDDNILERTSSFDLGNERETAAADVLAGICSSVPSEVVSSCITSSVDPGEGYCNWKYQNVDSAIKRPLIPDVSPNLDNETCSDESCGEMTSVDWTDEEKSIFIQAVSSYGKDFVQISRCVRTRSRDQCKVFFSKARKCLQLDLIRPGNVNVGKPASDDTNGGGSDAEDTCLVGTGSVVCSDKPGLEMDEDLPSSVIVSNNDESDPAEIVNKISQNCLEAVLTSIPEEYEMTNKPRSVGDVDASELLHPPKSAVTLINAEDGGGGQVTEREALFSGCSQNGSQDENCNAGTSGQDRDLQCSERDSNTIPNHSHVVAETICSRLSHNSENGHLYSLPSKSVEKSHVNLLQLERAVATANSPSQDSAVQCEKTLNQDRLSSTHDSESQDKQCRKSVSKENYQQNISGQPLLNHAESSVILRGYPLKLSCKEKVGNGDVSCMQQLPEVEGLSKSEGNFSKGHLRQGCHLQKCSSSSSSSVAEVPLLPQNLEQTSDYQNSRSRSLSDTEKPSRSGDVKLFGTILTTPCSQQSNSNTQENEEKGNVHNSMDIKSNSAPMKFDRSNYLSPERIPMRSYGFWDGNKIQRGFTSLPDSAILLAKYPAAFGSYPALSKIEQQPMQAVIKSNECSLNGVSVFPTSSSDAITDYQAFRSPDGTNVHPFRVEIKQRQDVLSEMQRLNEFESMSTLQHQSRGTGGFSSGFFEGSDNNGVVDAYELKVRLEHILERITLISEAANTERPSSISNVLFIGGALAARSVYTLQHLGVTHILCLCSNEIGQSDTQYPDLFEHKNFSISDNEDSNISTIFEEASDFIDTVEQKEGKVLVHCFEGKSRSATMVLAYLMLRKKFTLLQAWNSLKRAHRRAQPNDGFAKILVDLDRKLHGKVSMEWHQRKPTMKVCPICGKNAGLSSSSLKLHLQKSHKKISSGSVDSAMSMEIQKVLSTIQITRGGSVSPTQQRSHSADDLE